MVRRKREHREHRAVSAGLRRAKGSREEHRELNRSKRRGIREEENSHGWLRSTTDGESKWQRMKAQQRMGRGRRSYGKLPAFIIHPLSFRRSRQSCLRNPLSRIFACLAGASLSTPTLCPGLSGSWREDPLLSWLSITRRATATHTLFVYFAGKPHPLPCFNPLPKQLGSPLPLASSSHRVSKAMIL